MVKWIKELWIFIVLTLLPIISSSINWFGFGEENTSRCALKEHRCGDGSCINVEYVCDGAFHCTDNSDETSCRSAELPQPCLMPKFRCNDGTCLNNDTNVWCDGVKHCYDNSDESSCTVMIRTDDECPANYFRCLNSNKCIPKDFVCNKRSDCSDSSDENPALCSSTVNFFAEYQHCDPSSQWPCKKSKDCIPVRYRCDGISDCKDRSDEESCDRHPIDTINCTVENNLYTCDDKFKCIPIDSVCDGKVDCFDKSDEQPSCNSTRRIQDCINCTHTCKMIPRLGPQCICDSGFSPGNNTDCIDVNECESYGICDQKCTNTKGSYECVCDENYYLHTDMRSCYMKSGEFELLYSARHSINGISKQIHRTYITNIPSAIGISAAGRYIYWATIDHSYQAIVRSLDTFHEEPETIVTDGLGSPEDVAVDWMTNNLYFTDSKFKHIAVCSEEGYVCYILHTEHVDKPRAITLIPERGLMFWTDWGKRPIIGRSGMDGSNAIEFVYNDIYWPNGVAVDLPNERLYWVDAKAEKIESIKLDKTGRVTVLAEGVTHPFSIAVFENKLFWSDMVTREISTCNKFTGRDVRTFVNSDNNIGKLYGIHIRHPLLEQTKIANPCSRAKCSDLCLLAPSGRGLIFTCVCPINKVLASDGIQCIQKYPPPKLAFAIKSQLTLIQHSSLGRQRLKSISSLSVHIAAMAYNSRDDLLLIADSKKRTIHSLHLSTYALNPFITHGMGPVGAMDYDYFGHNLYWYDKDTLNIEALSLTKFSRTIVLSGTRGQTICDLALAPEYGLMFLAILTLDNEFRIERISMDGNLVSKINILVANATGPHIKLHYAPDMAKLFWIDGVSAVLESVNIDGTDRRQLRTSKSISTMTSFNTTLFWVDRKSSAIDWHDFSTDEFSEKYGSSTDSESRGSKILTILHKPGISSPCLFNSGGCSHLCLATEDKTLNKVCACPVGSVISVDGLTCTKPTKCSFHEFQCFTGECIPQNHVCDRKHDCIHGEDENLEYCDHPRCPPEQFLCFDNRKCVDRKSLCDGHFDCEDKSDEICNVTCAPGKYACDSGECIDLQFRCDGKVDCKNAHDEFHCATTKCSRKEYKCASGQCIPKEWECDQEEDCIDGSDEAHQCERTECFVNEYKCDNGKCVDHALTCDGVNDCGDDSDEKQCGDEGTHPGRHHVHIFKNCNSKYEFFCKTQRKCIPIEARCNGTQECSHGEDEENCTTNICRPAVEFYCRKDKKCIPSQWVCNKIEDCNDGSDEEKTACFHKTTDGEICSGFTCNDGQCIPLAKMCDSIYDCVDKSDEKGKCDVSCDKWGCNQKCFKSPNGPECKCRKGYQLDTNKKTCIDVNECHKNICSQNCTNTNGSFTCDCFAPEYRLRADRVSCKATGETPIYVVASRNKLMMNSNQMKHVSLLSMGRIMFNKVVQVHVDGMRNNVYVLLDDRKVERIAVTPHNEETPVVIQKLPDLQDITSFAVDWINENIYVIVKHSQIKVTVITDSSWNSTDEIPPSVDIYATRFPNAVLSLAVDPVAGYMFWYETYGNINATLVRADATGANSKNITIMQPSGTFQLILDSFGRHLYWYDWVTYSIMRINYDGLGIEMVLESQAYINSFDFFENSIYSVASDLMEIRTCKIYGTPPMKCESIKVSLSQIEHVAILQRNRHKTVPSTCDRLSCSMLCLSSPAGAQCACHNGMIQEKDEVCQDKTPPLKARLISNENNSKNTLAFCIIVCLIIGIGIFAYKINFKSKSEFLHRLQFHNSTSGARNDAYMGDVSQTLLLPNEHCYENPLCEVIDKMNTNTVSHIEETTASYLETLKKENESNSLSSNRNSTECSVKT